LNPGLEHMEDRSYRTERIIAGARLVLSIVAIELLLVDPSRVEQQSNEAYSAVALYFLYALAVTWIVDRNLMTVGRIGFYTQAADTLWFPIILLYTQGENSPFFLYYVFSLITASFRWGFKETFFVNTANVGMYVIVHFATARGNFSFYEFLVRPAYLYVLACLIGYLGEHQKRAQKQLMTLAELSSSIRIKHRFSRMLVELMEKLRQLFRVERCILVFHDQEVDRFFLRMVGGKKRNSHRVVELRSNEIELLFSPRQNLGYFVNPSRTMSRVFGIKDTLVYDFDHQRVLSQSFEPNKRLVSIFEMESVLSVPVILSEQFKGRIYLVNRVQDSFSNSDLQYLKLIVSQVGPLIESYRLLQRMQKLSILEEKNRIARDLHDGLVQSLASLDLRVQVCLKLCQESPQEVKAELAELQRIVRAEEDELRNFMKRLRTPVLPDNDLVEAIRGYIQNFERENGLAVNLTIEPEELILPRRISNEIYQIIHEGLTNVKKHAAARKVSIKLNRDDGNANLVISDDGCGFSTRVQTDDTSRGRAPWSIYERTRALKGTLVVESSPGHGSTLSIRLPVSFLERAEP
jgi:signal transduction histidine kinase